MHVRTAWPGGSPSVRSSAYESAPMTSESGTSAGRGPAPIAWSMPEPQRGVHGVVAVSAAHARPADHRADRPRLRAHRSTTSPSPAPPPDDRRRGRRGRRPRGRRLVPRGPADPRRVPVQAPAAVRSRQRGRRASCAARRTAPPSNPATASRRSACSAASPRSPSRPLPDLRAARRARLRPGRRADPQLPHRLLLADAARPPGRRARRCSCTAPPAASAPRRSRSPRGSAPHDRRGLQRREGARRARGRRRRGRALRRRPGRTRRRSSGGGVDVVLDPVGGDRFTDSLRSLGEGGRIVVVGFTGGSIPEVKVNRLLLNNTEVVGAGWGAYVMRQARREPRDRRRAAGAGRGASSRRSSARASRSSGPPRR